MFVRVTRGPHSMRLYVGSWHLHHGLQGLFFIALGTALVWHDRRDFPFSPLR